MYSLGNTLPVKDVYCTCCRCALYTLYMCTVRIIPYRMKIYTEFNLATLPRMVKFKELNVSEFLFLNFSYISHH